MGTLSLVSVDSLVPYANNANLHSEEQIDQIARSIEKFGFVNPVIIDGEKGIIAGHGRVLAAKKLGLKDAPCLEAAWLSEEEKRAYILADNKLAANSDWDEDLLKKEIDALRENDFDVSLLGFSNIEIEDLFAEEVDNGGLWTGMPEFVQEDATGYKQLLVSFKTKEDYEAFQKLIGQELTEKTRSIWFPYEAPINLKAFQIIDEEAPSSNEP